MSPDELRKADRKRAAREVVSHLEDFPRQLAALETAMAAFGEDFDLADFKSAFDGAEGLEAYNRVQAVERGVGRVQNYVAELAVAGVRLVGLPLGAGGSSAQLAFEALREAKAIDAGLCRRLVRAQRARSLVEHNYVRTSAGDVHRAVQLIHATAVDFIGPYRTWIEPHLDEA
jgi:hypothetical protein